MKKTVVQVSDWSQKYKLAFGVIGLSTLIFIAYEVWVIASKI